MRGGTPLPVMNFTRIFVFPAYAGVNLDKGRFTESTKGIPRVCGGEPFDDIEKLLESSYSPRMRG